MRVLMNALNGGNRSGTGRYISELAKALVGIEDENDYRFLWPRNLTAPFPDCESHFIRSSTAPLVRFFYEYRGMDGIAGRTQSDLVHYPTGIGPKFSKIPTVLTVHDMCFFHHPEWFSRSRALYYRITMAAGIRSADHLIADSQATAEDIMHFLDIPESRIDVVPLGVDTCFHPASSEEIRQVHQVYKLPERFFLFVGTLEPRKNLGRLIKAWTGVCDKVPSLVIAGRYGWGDSGLTGHESAENLMRLDHVAQKDLPALYSAAAAFVWPSLMEGFGLPPLEAMACGTPVLTSNTSSLPEVVGDAALQVNPVDSDALADAMVTLAQDEAVGDRLRTKGLERVKNFSWQGTAEKSIAVYKKVYDECCKGHC